MAGKRPIIVVHGAPEWVITFGDMMSLMLTFFILLFSISEIKKPKLESVAMALREHWDTSFAGAGYNAETVSDIVAWLAELADDNPNPVDARGGKASESIEHAWGDKAAVSKIDDTLHLEIFGRVGFAEGSAELLPEARELVEQIRDELAGYPNRVRVVGHCSPVPLPATSIFQDHDHLAFSRARAVAAVLTGEDEGKPGVESQRIEIASRGARDLLPGVDIFDAAERSHLARVEIIVTPENALGVTRAKSERRSSVTEEE